MQESVEEMRVVEQDQNMLCEERVRDISQRTRQLKLMTREIKQVSMSQGLTIDHIMA